MSEYINKEDLENFAMECVGGEVSLRQIHDFPAADVRPVVRCYDCFYSQHWYKNISMCFLWHKDGIEVFIDGFCNYGKKREESCNECAN